MIASQNQKASGNSDSSQPIVKALDQSEQVKDVVEECAEELSEVNAILNQEIQEVIVEHLPLQKAEKVLEKEIEECTEALQKTEKALAQDVQIESKMGDAAEE